MDPGFDRGDWAAVKGKERDSAHKSSFPSNLFWSINCLEVVKVRPGAAVSAGTMI